MGIVIPCALISSSVREFSFIEQFTSPFSFILNTFLQTTGFALIWPIGLYFLFSIDIKRFLTVFFIIISFSSLVNTFLAPENFGFLTSMMVFSEPSQYPGYNSMVIRNIILLLLIIFFVLLLTRLNKIKILSIIQIVAVISLSLYGITNIYLIHRDFKKYSSERSLSSTGIAPSDLIQPVYKLSKTKKNVILILTDNMISGYMPYIFNDNPELKETFSGWIYYPNCVSFGNHTMTGALPIYGGYEYTPESINKQKNKTLLLKQTEGYLLLPKIFYDAGFNVIVTDPPFDNYLETNLGIFRNYPEIQVENLTGKYTSFFLKKNPDIKGIPISDVLKRNLFYFSIFKCSPIFLRMYIYDNGDWLSVMEYKSESGLTSYGIDYYALFDSLVELTEIENIEQNTFTSIYEPLSHSYFFLQYPNYELRSVITDYGPSPFAKERYFHTNIAAYKFLSNFIFFLKENDVYDNTRIVIVSDHGRGNSQRPENIKLPNGSVLQSYNPLLMYKDFNASGDLQTDYTFMTNADVPIILTDGIITDPVNPFTGNKIIANKDNGVLITTIGALSSRMHTKYQYKINSNQWLYVKNDIFNPDNWSEIIFQN